MTNDGSGKVVDLNGSPIDQSGLGTAKPEAPSEASVHDVLIKPFMRHFGSPKVDDLDAYLADWVAAFVAADRTLLSAAVARTIRYRRSKSWPPMGEVTDNFNAAAHERDNEAARRETAASMRKLREREAMRVPHGPDSKRRVAAMAAKHGKFAAVAEMVLGAKRLTHAEQQTEIAMMAAEANREPDESASSEAPAAD